MDERSFARYRSEVRSLENGACSGNLGAMIFFREIFFGSQDYESECLLRDELLRRPLGLNLFEEDLASECDQWHFGLFAEDGSLLACGVALPVDEQIVKIRQVAVVEREQARGKGKRLMREIEVILRERGFTQVVLHARRSVSGFYLNCEYQIEGEEFEEVGLPHLRMVKSIGSG